MTPQGGKQAYQDMGILWDNWPSFDNQWVNGKDRVGDAGEPV